MNKILTNENGSYSVYIVKNHECSTRNLDEFLNDAIVSNDNDIHTYPKDTIIYLGSNGICF